MRRESGGVVGGSGRAVASEIDGERPTREDDGHDRRQPALQATGRTDADEGPHQEPQIEGAAVDEEPFQDVRVPPQMRAPHRACLVEMRIRAFQSLAAAPLQRPPARAANASAVGVHGIAGRRLPRSLETPTIGLGDVGP